VKGARSALERMRELLAEISSDCEDVARETLEEAERHAWKAMARKARKASLIGTSREVSK
jgi:hypothetical protein